MGQHQGGTIQLRNHRGHGEGLAGAGDAQQRLLPQSKVHSLNQALNCLGLIAGGLII